MSIVKEKMHQGGIMIVAALVAMKNVDLKIKAYFNHQKAFAKNN